MNLIQSNIVFATLRKFFFSILTWFTKNKTVLGRGIIKISNFSFVSNTVIDDEYLINQKCLDFFRVFVGSLEKR